jgi:hypothetical protein
VKRRPKAEPILAAGERPACAFEWKIDPVDGHRYSGGCACGLPYSEHNLYKVAIRQVIASERSE